MNSSIGLLRNLGILVASAVGGAHFRHKRRRLRPALMLALVLAGGGVSFPSSAAVLRAGPGQPYPTPSAAIKAAHDGDTVLIKPGTYYDCAMVERNNLTIAGDGPGVVLTDMTCAGKAILVVDGSDVTIRNLTLARARVMDGNGAGIRAEGHNLTVDTVRFVNDSDGILSAPDPNGTLLVQHSVFRENGSCDPRCGYGIEIGGALKVLRVVGSTFEQARGGSHIKSYAASTELVDNQMMDEGHGMTGPMIFVHDGSLSLLNNTFTIAAGAKPRPGIALVTGKAGAISVRGNALHEAPGQHVPLLRNWSGTTVRFGENSVPPGLAAVSDDGATYHRLRSTVRASLEAAKQYARHYVGALLRKLM